MKRTLALLLLPASALAVPIDFSADTVNYTPKSEVVVLTGNVQVTQGATTLAAGQLTISMSKGQPTRMVATGGATFTRSGPGAAEGALTATGSQATYTPGEDVLTLSGNVTLTRGGNTLRGENLVYDLTTGNAKLTGGGGRVSGSFTPQQ